MKAIGISIIISLVVSSHFAFGQKKLSDTTVRHLLIVIAKKDSDLAVSERRYITLVKLYEKLKNARNK